MQVELRKYRSELSTSGLGVIAFVIWSIAKVFLYLMTASKTENEVIDTISSNQVYIAIAGILIILIIVIDLGLRLFVGFSARAQGMGRKKSLAYVIVTILFMLLSLANIYFVFTYIKYYTVTEIAANLIFEISSFLIMLKLVISAFKVRSLEKITKAGAEHAA